jgi:hypothetical protein
MAKSRNNRKSIVKTITSTTESALPVVNKGLNTVGIVAQNVTEKSAPFVKKGISAVYGTMATGFDLGVKGVAKGVKIVSKKRRSRRNKKHTRRNKKHTRRH